MRYAGTRTQRIPIRSKPFFLQVQAPVQERVRPLGHGVAQEHADLTILDLSQAARVLPTDSARKNSLLAKPRIVDHPYPIVASQHRRHCLLMFSHHRIFIPARRDQKALPGAHATRAHLPGDGLGVLLTRVRQKPSNLCFYKDLHFLASHVIQVAAQEVPQEQGRLSQFCFGHSQPSRSLFG